VLRAVPMVHLQVQVPGRDGVAVTREIAAKGLLHLIDIAHGATVSLRDLPPVGVLLARFRDLSRSIHRLAETLGMVIPDVAGRLEPLSTAPAFDTEYQEIAGVVEPVREQVEATVRARAAARDEKVRLAAAIERTDRLASGRVDTRRLSRLSFAIARLGSAAPEELRRIAAQLTPAPFAIVPLDDRQPRPLAAVVVPTAGREQLAAVLRTAAFEPFDLPAEEETIHPRALREQLDAAEAREAAAASSLCRLAAQHQSLLPELAARADVSVLLLQAQSMSATAGRFLVISGWIPEDRAGELTAAIARVSDKRAVVTVEKPDALAAAYGPALSVPILHRNPLLLRPFDQLVRVYGVPSYGEIQPTAFFALSFLLMFGLMFGDVGHGLVLVSAGYMVFRYLPRFLDYGILLMEAGTASAFFGVLFGSVFGVEGVIPGVAHPLRDLTRTAAVAVALGVVLVSLGVLLNVVNSWRAGERVAALTSTRGLVGAFLYWSSLAVAARALLPSEATVPDWIVYGLAGTGIALVASRPLIVRVLGGGGTRPSDASPPRSLAALESTIELVDAVFSYFANTISFVRIAAFAAVHAGVFIAIFALADTFSAFRFGGPLSVTVLVAGNVAIILLEGLTVTVQVLRLEYYEFFSRFFRGGGEPYRPLMLRPNGPQGGL
jgi:V/A-type H+/Na+-transporting ATPase subunit I